MKSENLIYGYELLVLLDKIGEEITFPEFEEKSKIKLLIPILIGVILLASFFVVLNEKVFSESFQNTKSFLS